MGRRLAFCLAGRCSSSRNAGKDRQRCSRVAQRLNVPKRTPRLFARCGLAGRPFSASCESITLLRPHPPSKRVGVSLDQLLFEPAILAPTPHHPSLLL